MVWHSQDNEGCFRVVPEGCVYEETTQDTYVDICQGYDTVSTDIQKGLI